VSPLALCWYRPGRILRVMKTTTFRLDHTGLDAKTVSEMTDELTKLAYSDGPLEIRIDFDHVEWIGSAAVGLLIGLHRQVAGAAGRLVLVNVNAMVADILRLTRLDLVLEIRRKKA
jgi:anti-sigma B factor antagonist